MAARRANPSNDSAVTRPPARTPEGRESQLSALAVDLAEKQLREGTASAQVITHYLKLVSSREILEQKRIEQEIELAKQKTAGIESAARVEDLMKEAINAFKSYRGDDPVDDPYDER